MSREIKFRAWQKYHKKMLEVLDIGFKDGEVNSVKVKYPEDTIPPVVTYKKNDEKFWIDDDCIKLMQYTGLKDKNGEEIYEGDIVKSKMYLPIGDGSRERVLSDKGVMCYDKLGILAIKTDEYNEKPCYSDFFHTIELSDCEFEIEVIGNIYENPELLEEKQ